MLCNYSSFVQKTIDVDVYYCSWALGIKSIVSFQERKKKKLESGMIHNVLKMVVLKTFFGCMDSWLDPTGKQKLTVKKILNLVYNFY